LLRAWGYRHRIAGLICVPFVLLTVLDGFWKTSLTRGPLIAYWAFDFAKWVVLPLVLIKVFRRLTGVRSVDYGLSSPLGAADHFYVLPLPLFSLFLAHLVVDQTTARFLGYPEPYFDFSVALAALGGLWIVGTLYASATAALWESIFFISLPWLWISRGAELSRGAQYAFAFGTAIVFAIAHWENGIPNAVGAFVFQLIAVWWYLRLRTLWPIIGAHFLVDVVYLWPPAKL
jgi:membrane protease YdiL (CAAX protease family)